MRRLPIRLRLALAFAGVMALVLTATGLFVYLRFAADLDRTLDRELDARLTGVLAIVRDDGDDIGAPGPDPLVLVDEAYVQVLSAPGELLGASSPRLERRPFADRGEVRRLLSGELDSLDVRVPRVEPELRIKAASARDDGVSYTAIVGTPLDQAEEPLRSLATLLALGGPLALVLASLAGYWVASAALRPMEAMRRRAAAISARSPGERLPVPAARDEVSSLGATLNEMLARLERALERERAFVADASHELRTPLAILKVELELALRAGRSREELQGALASAAQETDRLVGLAEDLLVLARADEGRLAVKRSDSDVGELVARVRDRFAALAGEAGRRVRATAPPDGLRASVDCARVEQALSNLVDNALRHGAGDVEIAAAGVDGRVELRVSDAGSGFPDDLLGSAFGRFVRADGARSGGGSGLGLAIVEAIARAHGGSAGAANRGAGGGAEVWLSLPHGGGSPSR